VEHVRNCATIHYRRSALPLVAVASKAIVAGAVACLLWRPYHEWLLSAHLLLRLQDFLLKSVEGRALIMATLLEDVGARAVRSHARTVLSLVGALPGGRLLLDALRATDVAREAHALLIRTDWVACALVPQHLPKEEDRKRVKGRIADKKGRRVE